MATAIAAAPKAISEKSTKTEIADRQVETQHAVLTTHTNPTMHGDSPSVASTETKTTQPQLITAGASPGQPAPSPGEPQETDFPKFDLREIGEMSESDRRREADALELPELGNFIRPALVGNQSLVETYRPYVQSFMERTARQARQKLLTNEKGEPADREDVVREYLGVGIRRVNQLLATTDPKSALNPPGSPPQPTPPPEPATSQEHAEQPVTQDGSSTALSEHLGDAGRAAESDGNTFDYRGDLVNSGDLVNTPDELARGIVGRFLPQIKGRVLDPCEGDGAFTRAFAYHSIKDVIALEITRGSNFFDFGQHVDWIISNPPWSLARQFLQHAYRVADNIVFLITLNHIFALRSCIADMEHAGFGIKEVLLCKTPDKPWPQSGFQLAAIHLQRNYRGTITWGWLDDPQDHRPALTIRPSAHIVRASAFAIPLRDELVQTVVTSPPYFGLRKYPGGTEEDLGREKTIDLYVEHLATAMREVWRVLRNDGMVFLNLADSYHGSGRGKGSTNDTKMNPLCDGTPLIGQGKSKCLCLIPHRVMIALAEDGWVIRNDIIWEKENCVPESVHDRCTCSYEHVIVLVKSKKYYWDRKAAREPSVCWEKGTLGGGVTASKKDGKMKEFTMRHSNKAGSSKTAKRLSDGTQGERTRLSPPIGNVKHQALGKPTLAGHRVEMKRKRNMRDVWSINTRPHKDNHPAMFPEELVERCIRIGSKEGDIILDLFAGSGTTGVVAKQLGRNAVMLDISAEYCQLMRNRLSQRRSEEFEPRGTEEGKAEEGKPAEGEAAEGKPEEAKAEEVKVEQDKTDPLPDRDPPLSPRRNQIVVINQEFVSWARTYASSKFHACLCDPGYGYHFMGAKWDDPKQMTRNQVHSCLPPGQKMTRLQENVAFQDAVRQWGESLLPLLYPGALVMMFGGPRMFAWLATGMQLAGFEMWDSMTFFWVHAQGFPKAQDIARQVAKLTGEQPIGGAPNPAANWQGYKTPALKPGYEPILCFRAPHQGMTYAELATTYGTGCLNIDGGRIGTGAKKWDTPKGGIWHPSEPGEQRLIDNPLGRFPSNAIFDEESAQMLDAESGAHVSRFFYCAKASKSERNAGCGDLPNDHPCVKPLSLVRYLANLLLPPSSFAPRRILIPFAGSGSEEIGAMQADWGEVVGVEQNAHYCEIAERRIAHYQAEMKNPRPREIHRAVTGDGRADQRNTAIRKTG